MKKEFLEKFISKTGVYSFLLLVIIVVAFQFPIENALSKEFLQAKAAVLIILDYTSISELKELSSAEVLFTRFDGALLSARSGAPLRTVNADSIFATINSGDRVYVLESPVAQAYQKNEFVGETGLQAGEYFSILRGYEPKNSVIFPEFEFLRSGADENNGERIGLLGDKLKKSGVKRFVLGNGDIDKKNLYRNFAIILTDSLGEIGGGDVSRVTLMRNSSLPAGYSADYKSLKQRAKEILMDLKERVTPGIIVLYPGDTRRLEYFKNKMPESRYRELKKSVLEEYISIAESLSEVSDNDTLVCLVSISPAEDEIKRGSNTGFIFMKGWKYEGSRLLYSSTTRHEGTVFINDLTNTIAQYFGLNKSNLLGNEIIPGKKKLDASYLERISKEFLNTDLMRAPLISTLVFLIVITIVFVIISLFAPLSSTLLEISKFLIYISAFIPIAFLVFGYVLSANNLLGLTLITVFPLVATFYVLRKNYSTTKVTALSLLLVTFLILIDAPFSFLQRFSVLGYSFNTGARFYGIGNEAMGILASGAFLIHSVLGSQFVGSKAGVNRLNLPSEEIRSAVFLGALVIIFFTVYMIYPSAGANVGGSITILVGSMFSFYHALTRRASFRIIIYLAVGLVLMAGIFVLVTYIFPAFHLSKFVKSLFESNFDTAFSILYRKVALNLKLLKFTVWNKFLLAILIALPIIVTNPNDILRKFYKKDAWVESLLFGSAFGALTAFIFNDSGVVAAATLLIYPALIFMSELIQLRTDKEL